MMTELTQLPGVVSGEITGTDDAGRPLVRWTDAPPVPALGVWTPGAPRWSECVGARVLVGFLSGDEQHPVVLGLLEPPPGFAAPVEERERARTHCIEATDELVLECGDAKISLRHDGRVEIRGTHVISRSSGPNKVKGGSVFIN